MAFDGIVIAGLVHELNQTILNTKISKIDMQRKQRTVPCIHFSKRFPSFFISDGHQQDKSPAGTYILYGFAQTYRKRADHKHYPAPYGAHHPSEDRTPE